MGAVYRYLVLLVMVWGRRRVCALNCLNNDSLVMVHVIFRHGDRTPSRAGLWPDNPYYNESFYAPFGYGQLTNAGKLAEYELGAALRRRYARFLGDSWSPKVYDAWSTDYDRTKMSLALVLGGLYPPTEPVAWNPAIPWQPAPYHYRPIDQDQLLSSWACPTTVPLIYADAANMARLRSYDALIQTLSNNTGLDLDYISALDLYFGMQIQEQLGFALQNWTEAVYPEPLKSYIVEFYYLETSTRALKTVLAGYLLKKLLEDTTAKIRGALEPKIALYSGHEVNVATVLAALELYELEEPPPYASFVLFEVHRVGGVYGLRMFYQDYKEGGPHPLTLPGCARFCPLEHFVNLTAPIIPQSEEECLGDGQT